ncbi:MAG: chlorite dismutase family protein [SAR202 cluster bacterium]|nr:chlorite dismutase family protein [SAR202 cluster bacterium]
MTHPPPAQQFVKYTFFKTLPEWRRLPPAERTRHKQEFAAVFAEHESSIILRSYSLTGMRADADMMLWAVAQRLEQLQGMHAALARTGLGAYLGTTHSYLAMTRRSIYIDNHTHPGQTEDRTRIRPLDRPYLFVYPFVKTHAWYQLPMQERQRMMEEHFKIGHKYPDIRIHTTYSYGLDDQEFVLGFETDQPGRFLDLVMDLRSAEQRPLTERDTPIFTCLLQPIDRVLEALGG